MLGGRWKPLQYFFKDHLYTDLFVVCGDDARCFVKNDSPLSAFAGTLRLSALNVSNSAVIEISSTTVSLGKGAGAATWLCAGAGSPYQECTSWAAVLQPLAAAPTGTVLITELLSGSNNAVVYSSFELLATPAAMMGNMPKATVTAHVASAAASRADGSSVSITVDADGAALFVGLSTAAHGRFSRNFFVMAKGQTTVDFLPFGELDLATLKATLRVEHVRSHL